MCANPHIGLDLHGACSVEYDVLAHSLSNALHDGPRQPRSHSLAGLGHARAVEAVPVHGHSLQIRVKRKRPKIIRRDVMDQSITADVSGVLMVHISRTRSWRASRVAPNTEKMGWSFGAWAAPCSSTTQKTPETPRDR